MEWIHESQAELDAPTDATALLTRLILDQSPRSDAAATTALSRLLIAFLNEILWDNTLNIGRIYRTSTNKKLERIKAQ